MIMCKYQMLKVVEFDNGIIIMQPADNLQRPDMFEHIVADMETCAEYLVRYHEARAVGLDQQAAKERALTGANVLLSGVIAPQ